MAINDYVRCAKCGNAQYVRSNGACSYCKELLAGSEPLGVGGGPPIAVGDNRGTTFEYVDGQYRPSVSSHTGIEDWLL